MPLCSGASTMRQAPRRKLCTVALAGDGAIQLANSSGVENRLVQLDGVVVEARRERRQNTLNQIPAFVVVRQIERVEQVHAVAAFGADGSMPVQAFQIRIHFACFCFCR